MAPKKIKAWEWYKTLELAASSKTIYINGCFGASLDIPKNVTRYTKSGYNLEHADEIKAAAASGHCFGFDCIGYVRSTGWWGWCGDSSKLYGGATYKNNGMPDCSVHAFIRDFCKKGVDIEKGKTKTVPFLALLYDKDWSHIAVSIGNGIALEATRYGDKPGVRYVYIKNVDHPLIKKLDTRHYDAYAICKFVDYKGLWQAIDADGVMSILTAVPDLKPPLTVTEIQL